VCPFDALYMNEETDLPEIDWEKCTGCGKCVKVCPRGVLVLTSVMEQVQVACHSPAAGKNVRLICKKGCIKCQLCVKTCPVGAISSVDGMIKIDQEKCTRCDLCIEKCPTSSIVYLGKKAVSVA
ncbi:MAG: 4Fe-4S binding protein, partial [Atribacterota bacterium]